MKNHFKVLILILIAASSFLAGAWMTYNGGRNKATSERKILHYVDPMNPALKSDKPGIAPCGMPLEPVYADQSDSAPGGVAPRASAPPGTIRISAEKQQLIGVKTAMVEKIPWSHTLRVLGRVTPDETRTYRITAAVNGWIQDALPVTTGSLVKKDELLATFTFYSGEYRTALLAYFNVMKSVGAPGVMPGEPTTPQNFARTKELRSKEYENIRLTGRGDTGSQLGLYRQILFSYGIKAAQLEDMERTKTITDIIDIRAPAGGFILFRNVSPGLTFERGAELFRIADLSQVWILADLFETEASFFKPGMRVKMELPYQKKTLYSRMSDVLPQFDPATRTLKVRLVADNPGFAMRPDMFVNVELPINGPPAILVPVDALLDSGLKKTVFVDRGNGYFEPRQVETGRSLGERVEIVRGLMPGEKIVVSGNFLIDSEARMQQASAGINGKVGRDLVCGMNIDEDRSRAAGYLKEYQGKTYFFCSPECRDDFVKTPERYLSSAAVQGNIPPSKTKAKAVVDHPSHGAMKRTEPDGVKDASRDHDGMKMVIPKDPGSSSPSLGTSSMHGEKSGAMFPPASVDPVQMMPGPGAEVSRPGLKDPASTPAPGDMLPPPAGASAQAFPGQGADTAMPASPGAVTSTEPKTERTGRPTSRPPRRRGSVPFEGVPMPGAQEGSSVPRPTSSGIISPEASPGMTDRQTKATSDGQNHD